MRISGKKWFGLALAAAVLAGTLGMMFCRGPDESLTFDGAAEETAEGREIVVLLHGLARTPRSLWKMERRLQEAGYLTLNRGYPSRRHSVEELVEEFLAPLVDEVLAKREPGRIHFVTHSLGGILVRAYAAEHGADAIGRVVMLAPPNHGSPLSDRLRGLGLYRRFFGPVGRELGTGEEEVPARLPGPDFGVGVIAGTRSWWNPLAWVWISEASDGTVTVESTRLDEMADFREVAAGHSLIMRKNEVIALTRRFLEDGTFDE